MAPSPTFIRSRVASVAALVLSVALPVTIRPNHVRAQEQSPDTVSVQWDLPSNTRVHLCASDVPSFPAEDTLRADPKTWPAYTTIMGVPCSLRVDANAFDYTRRVHSLRDVDPEEHLSLSYAGMNGRRIGPAYHWRLDGTVSDRHWTSVDSLPREHVGYMYYKSGGLFEYEQYDTWNNGSFTRMEEMFSRNGGLIGFVVASGGGNRPGTYAAYWLGNPVDRAGFSSRMDEYRSNPLR